MTKEPIMIDGVDVSECPHIEYEHKWWDVAGCEQNSENVCALSFDNNADFEENFLCQDNPNCYYKQLKRKEQECERLKEEVSLLKESNSKLQPIEDVNSLEKYYLQQLDQLKAEIKELKHKNARKRTGLKKKQSLITQLKAEKEELKDKNNILRNSLKPFQDEYFKGLETIVIAGLAKKSIQITAENCKLEQALQEIKEIANMCLCEDDMSKMILEKCEVIDD